ncbi:nucleotide sugar dehydrogenase [Enterococcus termitis]|uniref:UDP-glucose 6-dehydrogenase n=1 Tax=Enterococcus termitis TaxID=332950 RepID=A0A1E5G858_9ENTE|nr:nucleotide sugar dehydrogenase [Enterococcus termitis]OEG08821.1 UDP-glucose 6-dehydrogenase [Enterococcus termitis]
MKIGIIGLGYVGLANALLLSQNEYVIAYDISKEKISDLKKAKSPIKDLEIIEYLAKDNKNLMFTDDFSKLFTCKLDYMIIATPTDYDEEKHFFNTSSVDETIEQVLSIDPDLVCVIKSTVPVGHTQRLKEKLNTKNILFSPEFLREGKALWDNLYPSRIIVGEESDRGQRLADMFLGNSKSKTAPVLLTGANEAEAIKLFSNTYLALRIAYFNELDTYAEVKGLNSKQIINGVGLDPRIGTHYNNPSFGYGGYCLPKDTKQLLANYNYIPNSIITSIVTANDVRKEFIFNNVIAQKPQSVGIYRLIMKSNSDNYRYSSVLEIIERIHSLGIPVLIYEPTSAEESYLDCEVCDDLDYFKQSSDIIVANRISTDLSDVLEKVYTRDLFGRD